MNPGRKAPAAFRKPHHEGNAAELLELLYFIYDKGISALAATMRGPLTRTQASILWLIRSEGAAGSMPRKEIARHLHDWFDLGNPAITSALQSLAEPPIALVRLVESVDSGREKSVILTAKGRRFVASMAARGEHLMRELLENLGAGLSNDQIVAGIEFLQSAVSFFQGFRPGPRARTKNFTNGNRPHPVSANGRSR